jgi:ribosome maturation factor RimP
LSKKVLDELLQPLVEELGYEFVGLEYSSNPKNAVLRIYIDAEDGVGVDDCSRVSREVAALLDVEDPIPGHYNLEISSPGLDRPLFTLAQYERFTGSEVKLSLFAPQDGRRKLKGVILGVDLEQVRIAVEDVEMVVYFNNIAKANLVPDYARLMAGDGDSELQAD